MQSFLKITRNGWLIAFVISMSSGTLSAPAKAGYYESGNDLYASCNASPSTATYYQNEAACSYYVRGIVDHFELVRQVMGASECVPENVNIGQIVDVVKNYLRDHPEVRQRQASILVQFAVTEAFCSAPVNAN